MLQGYIHKFFFPVPYQRIENTTPCGQDKSVLDVYPSFDENHDVLPIVFILPGLRGYSQDCPGISVVKRFAATKRFRVIVHHRRGHVEDEKIKAGVFHFAGDPDDLSCSIRNLRDTYPEHANVPIFLMGLSLGSALAVVSAGYWDRMRKERKTCSYGFPPPDNIGGMVLTSAGFDITRCFDRFPWPYSTILRECLKDHFIRKNEDVLRNAHGDEAVDNMLKVNSLGQFVDGCYKFAGCSTREDFFDKYNPVLFLPHFTTPCMVLLAIDDPITVIENCLEVSPYPDFGGMSYKQYTENRKNVVILGVLPQTGSHCTFIDGGNFDFMEKVDGLWMLKNWSEDAAVEFCLAVVEDINSSETKKNNAKSDKTDENSWHSPSQGRIESPPRI